MPPATRTNAALAHSVQPMISYLRKALLPKERAVPLQGGGASRGLGTQRGRRKGGDEAEWGGRVAS